MARAHATNLQWPAEDRTDPGSSREKRGSNLRVFTVQEVARLVRVSERTVWRELKSGRLRGTRFGGQWRIIDTDLHAYLDQRATIPVG